MKVLVACEYSGRVREAFKDKGHDAWSCDLVATEQPGQHLKMDVFQAILENNWDMMVAFPPCTHLCSSGARWWKDKPKEQHAAYRFFLQLAHAPIERIAMENPVGYISTAWRKPDQIIHPWMFGDSYSKKTCLWLKNLPPLEPTNIVDPGEYVVHGGKRIPRWYSNRELKRDLTFPGIATAMAQQWSTHK